jgi:hypothetical protein
VTSKATPRAVINCEVAVFCAADSIEVMSESIKRLSGNNVTMEKGSPEAVEKQCNCYKTTLKLIHFQCNFIQCLKIFL